MATASRSSEEEGDAIRALGPLFRVTEVFLWDDDTRVSGSASGSRENSSRGERSDSIKSLDIACSSVSAETNGNDHEIDFSDMFYYYTGFKDLELAEEMGAMGLPTSFSTTKERKNVVTRRHQKGITRKTLTYQNVSKSSCFCSSKSSATSSQAFMDSLSTHCSAMVSKMCSHLEAEDVTSANIQSDGEYGSLDIATNGISISNEQTFINLHPMPVESLAHHDIDRSMTPCNTGCTANSDFDTTFLGSFVVDSSHGKNVGSISDSSVIGDLDMSTEVASYLGSPESCQHAALVDHGIREYSGDSKSPDKSGNWTVVWDTFYGRNYFYNVVTQESTWYQPPGLQDPAYLSRSSDIPFDENKDKPAVGVACATIKDNDACKMQEVDPFSGTPNDSKSSVWSCHRQTSEVLHIEGNSISDITQLSETESASQLEDTLVEGICSNINKLCYDFTGDPFHSSDIQECHESLENVHKHSNLDKVSCPFFFNLETHGIAETFHEPENNIIYLETFGDPQEHVVSCQYTKSTRTNELDPKEELRSFILPRDFASLRKCSSCCHDPTTIKRKKKVRKIRYGQKISDLPLPDDMDGFSPSIVKYWYQRYTLFSKFDCGIKMDEEGWFSVTPELIARHHASRCGDGTVIDCFAGAGGNAIQFAMRSNHVIAIDIDPLKIDHALHNATIYGVQDHIDFVEGDFFHLAVKLKGDVIFMSPPWGGPDYFKVQSYDIKTMLRPKNGDFLFQTARVIAPKIVMFLPRNVDLNQLAELALLSYPPWDLEVEKNFLNGKFKAVTAYFSDTSSKTRKTSF